MATNLEHCPNLRSTHGAACAKALPRPSEESSLHPDMRPNLSLEPNHLSVGNKFDELQDAALRCGKGELHASSLFPLGGFSAPHRTETRMVIMRPAAACDGDLRQRRLIWCGAAYRLSAAAPVPPLTCVASSLGYELDCLVQEFDNQGHQSQESVQPVHRQITSPHRRRRCRLAGLTPLTYQDYSSSDYVLQTYVRILSETFSTVGQGLASAVLHEFDLSEMPSNCPTYRKAA